MKHNPCNYPLLLGPLYTSILIVGKIIKAAVVGSSIIFEFIILIIMIVFSIMLLKHPVILCWGLFFPFYLSGGSLFVLFMFAIVPIGTTIFLNIRKISKQYAKEEAEKAEREYKLTKCCNRCEIELSKLASEQIKEIEGKRYCDDCAKIVYKEAHATCDECAEIMWKREMRFIGDKYYCHDCYEKYNTCFRSDLFSQKSYDNPMRLFTFNRSDDTETYTSENTNLYIDTTTGKLTTRRYVSSDPFSARPGSVSVFENEVTYDTYKKIVSYLDVKEIDRFKALNEDNWQEWLWQNGLVKRP